jgi:HAD superfamily hydrolase (TIGR01549 family)
MSADRRLVTAVIFDIDGTLLDSVDLHAQAWQHAFLDFGYDIPFHDIRAQIGKGGDRLIPALLREADVQRVGKDLDRYRGELFKREYLPKVRPFARVRELFQRLRHDGKRIVLGSSAKGDELEAYKRIANIADLVEGETSADDADSSKPAPDIFEAALQKLRGVDAADAIVVGDTPYDAEAAVKARLRVIGVLCGGFPEQDLRDAGCFEIYRDPADLLERYDATPLALPHAA